ncbi:hypothetical protein Pogu_0613 [Pyrobaculum oguniense TE7]|uniref:Uncharacterized protein n=1 Tax=Pyrobaculum oguniense (strain DSM 13380 / JCM 10595 / TE7) TaxID=698757 RepID=H6Q7Y3_PYROT|nr:hypothetical protein Pogu_0613 [Pyrobaculum oguniense TE7]
MRLELALIPVLFGFAVAVMLFAKPVEAHKPDLSAVFVYWPEAFRYAERGDATAIQRVAGLVVCATSGVIDAPPGVAYRVLSLSCRFRP